MNLRFLETFIWVARLRSFGGTAQRLGATQAAVSNRIAALERELGVRLFERDPRAVRLTPEGQALLARAEEIVRLSQDFVGGLSRGEAMRGRVSIATVDSIVHSWLPGLIQRIGTTWPAIDVDLIVESSLNIAAQLQEGRVDLGLIMGPVVAQGIENHEICSLRCSWFAGPRLGLPAGRLTIAALAAHPILAFSRGSQPYRTLERILQAAGVARPRLHSLNSIATMVRLARDGLGSTLLPDAVIPQLARRGDLRRLDVDMLFPPLVFHAVCGATPRQGIAQAIAAMAREEAARFDAPNHAKGRVG
jgi:DNA-binding transcriptional LysR family regulator